MTSFHLSFQTRATEGRSHRENVGRRAIACRKSRLPPREDRNRKSQRAHGKARKRTGDASPKRVNELIETGNALVTEAKGLGQGR